EVEVVGGVLIMQEDEADLDLVEGDAGDLGGLAGRGVAGLGSLARRGVAGGGGLGRAAGGESKDHHECKQKRKKLLHLFSSKNSVRLKGRSLKSKRESGGRQASRDQHGRRRAAPPPCRQSGHLRRPGRELGSISSNL